MMDNKLAKKAGPDNFWRSWNMLTKDNQQCLEVDISFQFIFQENGTEMLPRAHYGTFYDADAYLVYSCSLPGQPAGPDVIVSLSTM